MCSLLGFGIPFPTVILFRRLTLRSHSTRASEMGSGGVMGTLDLCLQDSSVDLTDKVHLLPCVVGHDGPCAVSDYFKPKQTGVEVDGLKVEEAFFRGRRLQGTTVQFPDGYCGYVLDKKDTIKGNDMDHETNDWESRAVFENLTYWNHDDVPSKDDPVLRCFHWFTIAEALHKTVTEEDLACASNVKD